MGLDRVDGIPAVVGTASTGVRWEWGLPLPERYINTIDQYSDPLIYCAFLCRILVLLLPLIPYCVHFALSKALFFYDDGIYC